MSKINICVYTHRYNWVYCSRCFDPGKLEDEWEAFWSTWYLFQRKSLEEKTHSWHGLKSHILWYNSFCDLNFYNSVYVINKVVLDGELSVVKLEEVCEPSSLLQSKVWNWGYRWGFREPPFPFFLFIVMPCPYIPLTLGLTSFDQRRKKKSSGVVRLITFRMRFLFNVTSLADLVISSFLPRLENSFNAHCWILPFSACFPSGIELDRILVFFFFYTFQWV